MGASSSKSSTNVGERKMSNGDAPQVKDGGSGKSSKLQPSGLESVAAHESQRGRSRSFTAKDSRSTLNLRSRSSCTWRRRRLSLLSRGVKRRRLLAGEVSHPPCQEVVGKNFLLVSDIVAEKRAAPLAAHVETIQ